MSDMTAATGTPVASVRDNRGNSGTDPELEPGRGRCAAASAGEPQPD
ncbi:TPA: hypothetical protein N3A31_000851 [Salmonella enterica subsp. houtenae serovar 43:z4,z32:-]|nr:hypothetical protein [Salmonella enterica]EJK4621607.1 hypothetical protein [Salmonella enterica]HCM1863026.1 hypothetical protein [Salmonella enterica subsp. houtenae serovar 43:z4,z32:-]